MTTLTQAQKTRIHERLIMATYYAYGRNDAADLTRADAEAFGSYYANMWADVESGAASFCSSVQDAFGYYISVIKHLENPPVAGIANEIRDFLAKSIDEAGMADLDAIDDGSTR